MLALALGSPAIRSHPHTGRPLAPLGVRRDGRLIWPILGASPDDDGTLADDAGGGAGGEEGAGPKPDTGYPANTPLAEMTESQQLAYWKAQSRKHESAAKARGDYDELKSKADEFDRLAAASRTEHEKAIEDARVAALAEGRQAIAPKLLAAEFRAEGAGRKVNGKPLDVKALVDGLDAGRFLTNDGDVDTDKVVAFLDGIAPKSDTDSRAPDLGQGNRGSGVSNGAAAGLAEAQRRFGVPSQQ